MSSQFPSFTSAVEPPITVPYFWWKNGDPSLKQLGQALYYGGWFAKTEEVALASEDNNYDLNLIKEHFERNMLVFEDEGEVEHFGIRSLTVAPIAYRKSWFNKELRRRSPTYFSGSRQHIQVVAYMGVPDANAHTIKPWGIVILSAKGFNAGYLMQALHKSLDSTRKACRLFGVNEPPHVFWHMIGTFGQNRQTKTVGKGQTSKITPIMPYTNITSTKEQLMSKFVGDEVKAKMVEALDAFREWLEAWNTNAEPEPEADVEPISTEEDLPW